MATATFGAGCFWGIEATFRRTDGVIDTAVGYAGGHTENPTYAEVCSNCSGHAEVVQIEYDPAHVSYEEILDIFWNSHDPTQLNRQGPDIGDQYRSVIFFHTSEQEAAAFKSKEDLDASGAFGRSITTVIEAAPTFWKAEEHHQRYLEKRGQAACSVGGNGR